MSGAGVVVYLVFVIFEIGALWRVFTKAGKPGWGSIIPLYNIYLLCKVAQHSGWWFLLFLVPIVNVIVFIVVWYGVARAFGHGVGFTAGLVLLSPIFLPILGYGSSKYRGRPQLRGY